MGGNANAGPPVFLESRTPTALAANITSTQSFVPLSPLWLLLRQLTSTQLSVPLSPL
jgi:hypothetical protein